MPEESRRTSQEDIFATEKIPDGRAFGQRWINRWTFVEYLLQSLLAQLRQFRHFRFSIKIKTTIFGGNDERRFRSNIETLLSERWAYVCARIQSSVSHFDI